MDFKARGNGYLKKESEICNPSRSIVHDTKSNRWGDGGDDVTPAEGPDLVDPRGLHAPLPASASR